MGATRLLNIDIALIGIKQFTLLERPTWLRGHTGYVIAFCIGTCAYRALLLVIIIPTEAAIHTK